MTGPEHYRIAQDLILAQTVPGGRSRIVREYPNDHVIAVAQVHATLALAAATVFGFYDTMPKDILGSWDAVAS